MNAPTRPLHSLDAWPGESTQPPLRLLEPTRLRSGHSAAAPHRPRPPGWLQRLRRVLISR
ncbi:hypothetical protein AACH06_08840 [Ideonella sp. DXS29W]|uniref:Uncharacterized protein n=1 Tax=Ideonella lacteola TaxID=2984193 RepID=A0ABU9BPY7_9BURK